MELPRRSSHLSTFMKSLKSPPPSSGGPMATAAISFRRREDGLSVWRFLAVIGPCALFCLAVILIAPLIGSTGIGLSTDRQVLLIARLPRVLFSAVVGGALAVAGVLFQAILRNSLADPFTLGISAGSSFGAVVAIWLGLETVIWGIPTVSIAAFGGAFLAIVLVFFIARTGQVLPTLTLLLAGITLNFVFGAVIMFIHYAANFSQGYLMSRWMMGAVDSADMGTVTHSAPLVVVCLFGLLWISAQLNPLAAGEEWAASRGIDVRRVKNAAYLLGSILT